MCATSALSQSRWSLVFIACFTGNPSALYASNFNPVSALLACLDCYLSCALFFLILIFHTFTLCASQQLTFPIFAHTHIIYKSGSFHLFAVPTSVSIFLLAVIVSPSPCALLQYSFPYSVPLSSIFFTLVVSLAIIVSIQFTPPRHKAPQKVLFV